MKAILEFDLPDDKEQFNGANKALDFWLCLVDLRQYIGDIIKKLSQLDKDELCEEMLDEFWEILGKYNVTLDEYS